MGAFINLFSVLVSVRASNIILLASWETYYAKSLMILQIEQKLFIMLLHNLQVYNMKGSIGSSMGPILKRLMVFCRLVGHWQRGDQPLIRDPRVLLARVPRARARDAGHVAGGRAHGAARLPVRRTRRAARQAGLHVHAHPCRHHLLRARGDSSVPTALAQVVYNLQPEPPTNHETVALLAYSLSIDLLS